MLKIITPRRLREYTTRHLYIETYSLGGFAFAVEPNGELRIPTLATWDGFKAAVHLACTKDSVRSELVVEEGHYYEAAIGRCACGERVYLEDPMTNACSRCGRLYNGSGQELAPMSQWGCDTGESLADILGPDRRY